MPVLQGEAWVGSEEKLEFDLRFQERFGPSAAAIEAFTARLLSQDFEPGTDPHFRHARQTAVGEELLLPKLRTMSGEDSDETPSISKVNPRIASKLAWLVRDLALDELPQLRMLGPQLSVVGPRPQHTRYHEYYLWLASGVDKGLARAYDDEIYNNSNIRQGLTGPLQLNWLFDNERSVRRIMRGWRADLEYYPDKATRARDEALIAATPPALVLSALWKRRPLQLKKDNRSKNHEINQAIEARAAGQSADEEAV